MIRSSDGIKLLKFNRISLRIYEFGCRKWCSIIFKLAMANNNLYAFSYDSMWHWCLMRIHRICYVLIWHIPSCPHTTRIGRSMARNERKRKQNESEKWAKFECITNCKSFSVLKTSIEIEALYNLCTLYYIVFGFGFWVGFRLYLDYVGSFHCRWCTIVVIEQHFIINFLHKSKVICILCYCGSSFEWCLLIKTTFCCIHNLHFTIYTIKLDAHIALCSYMLYFYTNYYYY